MSARLEVHAEGRPDAEFTLEPAKPSVLGRADGADHRVPGEPHLSRRHVELRLEGERLSVRRLEGAANPVFYRGKEAAEFQLAPGEQFVIGATRFVFAVDRAPEQSQSMSEADLYALGSSTDRLRLLDLMELPEILRVKSPGEFYLHIAVLLRMATGAAWARVATAEGAALGEDRADDKPGELRWSRSLVAKALAEAPRPTLYRWSAPQADLKASVVEGADWAVCAAVEVPGQTPVVFYVSGRAEAGEAGRLAEHSRFVGLVADMVGRSLSVRKLETMQGRLERYFSGPVISKILKSADPKELEPRVAESTIMFFDIRGFSKRTEGRNEKILEYLGELRRVMSAMTEEIFRENGVVLSYMGDGILACWNLPLADPAHVDRACRAALRMAARIGEVTQGWRCGIGLHTGEVVAGTIGSDQVFSYSVMGAVVNQASRIEGITKAVETPILVTREVAERVTPEAAATLRLGRFQPAGMNAALDLYELLPPPGDPARAQAFAEGLAAFEKGDWETAYEILDKLPPKDLPARNLKALAERYRRHPPKDWSGVIELTEK